MCTFLHVSCFPHVIFTHESFILALLILTWFSFLPWYFCHVYFHFFFKNTKFISHTSWSMYVFSHVICSHDSFITWFLYMIQVSLFIFVKRKTSFFPPMIGAHDLLLRAIFTLMYFYRFRSLHIWFLHGSFYLTYFSHVDLFWASHIIHLFPHDFYAFVTSAPELSLSFPRIRHSIQTRPPWTTNTNRFRDQVHQTCKSHTAVPTHI